MLEEDWLPLSPRSKLLQVLLYIELYFVFIIINDSLYSTVCTKSTSRAPECTCIATVLISVSRPMDKMATRVMIDFLTEIQTFGVSEVLFNP